MCVVAYIKVTKGFIYISKHKKRNVRRKTSLARVTSFDGVPNVLVLGL
jgi:hypothetical protein